MVKGNHHNTKNNRIINYQNSINKIYHQRKIHVDKIKQLKIKRKIKMDKFYQLKV
jgi:hypothetical protein